MKRPAQPIVRHRPRSRSDRLGPLVFLGLWLLVTPAGAADDATNGQLASNVKAAFIYNFVKFVEWPPAALGSSGGPLVVGSLGHDAVSEALAASPWEPVGGHPVVVRQVEDEAGCRACHVLYVSPSWKGRLSGLLGKLSTRPVLTVGDCEEFQAEGGLIRLFLEQGKVRFSICWERAKRAGLRLTAGLLQVARLDDCR